MLIARRVRLQPDHGCSVRL